MGRSRNRPTRVDPDKPPRPRNAWMLFLCAYHTERTKKQEMNIAVEAETQQHTKIISAMWKALPEDERQKWLLAAEREKEEHARMYPNYKYRPAKTTARKQSTASASPPPSVPTQSDLHPSVPNPKGRVRSSSNAPKPKEAAIGSTPANWAVPLAAKKAQIKKDYGPGSLKYEHAAQVAIQQREIPASPQQRYSQEPATTPASAASKLKRGRPPRAKQQPVEEDIDNLELVDGQLVPKANIQREAMSEDSDSDDDLMYPEEEEDEDEEEEDSSLYRSPNAHQPQHPQRHQFHKQHENLVSSVREDIDSDKDMLSESEYEQAKDRAPAVFALRPATF